jgi:hypothetical protein
MVLGAEKALLLFHSLSLGSVFSVTSVVRAFHHRGHGEQKRRKTIERGFDLFEGATAGVAGAAKRLAIAAKILILMKKT